MDKNHEDKPAPQHTRIKPADISFTPQRAADKTASSRPRPQIHPLLWPGLIILLVFVLGVIFVLPNWVSIPSVEVTQQSTDKQSPGNTAQTATVRKQAPSSPWDEAQQARLRKDTQDILSQMLQAQDELQTKNVKLWAEQTFSQAQQLATTGDAAYRQRDFAQALSHYQQALETFNGLLQSVDKLFDAAIQKGRQALEHGNSAAAAEAFQHALILKPGNQSAIKGNKRAGTLDEVLALIAQADILLQNNQLLQAKKVYQQILDLDQDTEQATEKLKQVNQTIVDRDFTRSMSGGYSALEKNELNQAHKAFTRAIRIKPAATEARNALSQTVQRITSQRINTLLEQASDFEKSEQWLQAVAKYDEALTLDANLASARQGKQYSLQRAYLHRRLLSTFAHPQRLSNKAVYNEAVNLQRQAQSVTKPGPVLKKQIAFLSSLLIEASTPVPVKILSNDLTEVTLYKVGKLGHFQSKQLPLAPGRYTAVGSREGYRDVRVEFTVAPNKPSQSVIVQCDDKIALKR